jgi:uncharacterized phage protein (TIGR01671 family)
MNREIKFRAWHTQVVAMKPVEWMNFKGDLLKVPFYGNWARSSCVLMQYTGLKDKNGKEIYEGDIVKWNNRVLEYMGKVEYIELSYRVTGSVINVQGNRVNFDKYLIDVPNFDKNFEVIGNIYENPDLLEEKPALN